jgi:hypothetical protein
MVLYVEASPVAIYRWSVCLAASTKWFKRVFFIKRIMGEKQEGERSQYIYIYIYMC